MSKLEVFLLLTLKCYSENSEVLYKNTFLENTSIQLLLRFYKKILTNLKNVRRTKVQKRFIYWEKEQTMEQTEKNSYASYSN